MTKPKCPCLGCETSGTLHKRCELYSQYKEDMEKWNSYLLLQHEIDNTLYYGKERRDRSFNTHFKPTQRI